MILLPNQELQFHNITRTPNECGGFNHPGSGVGDFRSDSVAPLTAVHAVLVREHNRLCDRFANENPSNLRCSPISNHQLGTMNNSTNKHVSG